MTSANVVEFTVATVQGVVVGNHRQHLLCKSIKREFDQYQPPDNFLITAHGFDEHEAPWTDKPRSLKEFLSR